jgi:hypothetical protein
MNNRNLLIVLLSGVLLLVAGNLLRGKRSSSFDPQLLEIDTAQVERIQFISNGAQKSSFELKPDGHGWVAVQGNIKVNLKREDLKPVLSTIADLEAKRIVTRDESKYPEYEITNDQATEVIIWQNGKQAAHLLVGGFRFDQVARTASTFVRKAGEPEVYLIDGFTGMSLKASFDQFRDKKLVKGDAEDLNKVEWSNAAGLKQVIQKEDGAWYYAGMEAVDSLSFQNYLTALVNAQGSDFSELTKTDGLTLAEQLILYGNTMEGPTTIRAFIQQDTLSPFLLHSSTNPESIFKSDSTGLYKRIFTDLRQFWPNGQ